MTKRERRQLAEEERCRRHVRYVKIDAAFRAGDLDALLDAVEDPDLIPNGLLDPAIGRSLEYAIYHSPLAFIRQLLERGANPRPDDHAGFPPLIAALSCGRAQPGAPGRSDVIDIIALLLAFGADPHQRGINDYTALHMAVAEANEAVVSLLLDSGADPRVATRIDDCETARQMADRAGLSSIATRLGACEAEWLRGSSIRSGNTASPRTEESS